MQRRGFKSTDAISAVWPKTWQKQQRSLRHELIFNGTELLLEQGSANFSPEARRSSIHCRARVVHFSRLARLYICGTPKIAFGRTPLLRDGRTDQRQDLDHPREPRKGTGTESAGEKLNLW